MFMFIYVYSYLFLLLKKFTNELSSSRLIEDLEHWKPIVFVLSLLRQPVDLELSLLR